MGAEDVDAHVARKPAGATRTILVSSKVDSGRPPICDVDQAKCVYDALEQKGHAYSLHTRPHEGHLDMSVNGI